MTNLSSNRAKVRLTRDERTFKFCDPDPAWFFKTRSKSHHSPKSFSKCKFQVQMKSKIFSKCSLFTTKMLHLFSINSVQFWSGSQILRRFTVRIQSKFNKICYSSDPVQSNNYQQRWPELLFQTGTPLLFQNSLIRARIRVRLFFKFENPTPVQTPATIIDPTVVYPCFYLRNDRTCYCYCGIGKVTLNGVRLFTNFLLRSERKRRILPESTPVTGSGPTSANH